MEARLTKRHNALVKSHMAINTKTSAGVKSLLEQKTSFNQTQAAWRFFNNPNCTLKDLSSPLLDAAHEQITSECNHFGLVVHDWSNITYNRHSSKKDVYNTFLAARGYQLQSSLLISDKHGGPLAPLSTNLKSKTELLSSYGTPSRNCTNLEELA